MDEEDGINDSHTLEGIIMIGFRIYVYDTSILGSEACDSSLRFKEKLGRCCCSSTLIVHNRGHSAFNIHRKAVVPS